MSDSVLATIREFEGHSDPEVRKNVCVALGLLPGDEALEQLIRLAISDPSESVRAFVRTEIADLPAPRRQAIYTAALRHLGTGEHDVSVLDLLRDLRIGLGPQARPTGVPLSTRLRFAAQLGMPRSWREGLRTNLVWLIGVGLGTLLLVFGLAWSLERRGGASFAGTAQSDWAAGAVVLAIVTHWLWGRRRTVMARHLTAGLGLAAESTWSALCGVIASPLVCWLIEQSGRRPDALGPSGDIWRDLPVLALQLGALTGLARLGMLVGAMGAFGANLKRRSAWFGVAGGVGALLTGLWALPSLLEWLVTDPHGSLWPAALLTAPALVIVVLVQGALEGASNNRYELGRVGSQAALLTTAAVAGAGLIAAAMAQTAVEASRSRSEPRLLTPDSNNSSPASRGRYEITAVPVRVEVVSPGPQTLVTALEPTDAQVGHPENLQIVVRRRHDAGELPTTEEVFDTPESGCLRIAQGTYDVLVSYAEDDRSFLPSLFAIVPRFMAEAENLRQSRKLTVTLDPKARDVFDDPRCGRKPLSGDDAMFRTDETVLTPRGLLVPGSTVRLRKPTLTNEGPGWISEMDTFAGRPMTIKSINKQIDPAQFLVEENTWKWDVRWIVSISAPAATGLPAPAASK
jgi:hypothetical protein